MHYCIFNDNSTISFLPVRWPLLQHRSCSTFALVSKGKGLPKLYITSLWINWVFNITLWLVFYKDLVLYFPVHIDEISNIAGFLVRVLAVAAEAHHSFQKVTSDLILRSAVGLRSAPRDST